MGTNSDEARRAEAAWSASRRMIARKERPSYRIADTGDGHTVYVIELPWLPPVTARSSTAIEAGRRAIAEWLEVSPDTFDVERG